MKRLLPRVWSWSKLSPPHGYHFNGHLLLLPGLTLCVDPVEPDEEELHTIAEHMQRGPSRIVLTNRNHSRAANLLRERTGAPVAIHRLDAEHARRQGTVVDVDLRPGEGLGPLEVVTVPGKSPGEVALYWAQERLLLVGDALVGNPPGQLGLLREQVLDDPPLLRESVRGLLRLSFDTILCGDGEPVLAGARQALERLVQSFGSLGR